MHSPSFQYRRCSLRFRRWSRRNYAAFVSLGREVLIGHLRCDVADCSMLKLKHHLHADGGCDMARTAGDDGSGYPPDVGLMWGLYVTVFPWPVVPGAERLFIPETSVRVQPERLVRAG